MISSMPLLNKFYSKLKDTLLMSEYYTYDNEYADLLPDGLQTDAANELEKCLNKFFREEVYPISVKVVSLDECDFVNKAKFQSNKTPNTFIVSGELAFGVKGKTEIVLYAATSKPNFDHSKIDPSTISEDVAITLRHELIHDTQYTAISESMSISKIEVADKLRAWKVIPDYGASRRQYLRSHIELDAFGHEFAERLTQKFGLEESMKLVQSSSFSNDQRIKKILKRKEFGINFNEYFEDNPEEKFTRLLLTKIKKHLSMFAQYQTYQ